MGSVWWISCTWEQYIELHICPVLRRDTFLFHMFMQLRDPRKPNSGVCLRRQIGIVLCVCVNAPSPSACVCLGVGGISPHQTCSYPTKAKRHKHRIFIHRKPTGWKCSSGGARQRCLTWASWGRGDAGLRDALGTGTSAWCILNVARWKRKKKPTLSQSSWE